jgi:hypothetical protein
MRECARREVSCGVCLGYNRTPETQRRVNPTCCGLDPIHTNNYVTCGDNYLGEASRVKVTGSATQYSISITSSTVFVEPSSVTLTCVSAFASMWSNVTIILTGFNFVNSTRESCGIDSCDSSSVTFISFSVGGSLTALGGPKGCGVGPS